MNHILLSEEHSLHIWRHSERKCERLAPQVCWKLVEDFQIEIQLAILLVHRKCGVELNGQHVEGALELILHRDALTQWWLKVKVAALDKSLVVN